MISDRLNKLVIFHKLQPTKEFQSRTRHMVTWYIHMAMSYRMRDFVVQNPHWVGCPCLECHPTSVTNWYGVYCSCFIFIYNIDEGTESGSLIYCLKADSSTLWVCYINERWMGQRQYGKALFCRCLRIGMQTGPSLPIVKFAVAILNEKTSPD